MKTRLVFITTIALAVGMAQAGYTSSSHPTSDGAANMSVERDSVNDQWTSNSRFSEFSKNEIKTVQETLKSIGFNVGPVDGLVGPRTKNALMQYQASNDLKETGWINEETIDSLKAEVDTSILSE